MSNYTTEVRFICEYEAGLKESVGYADINDVVKKAAPKIFGDFPIFDESYRNVLETKILKHYYLREISEETVGLWKFRLNTKMNEIMPYYNKLYETETFKFNPLYDVDYWRQGNRDTDEQVNEKTNGSSSETAKMTGTIRDDQDRTLNITRSRSENGTSEGEESATITDNGTTTNTKTKSETGTTESTGRVTDEGTVEETGGSTESGATTRDVSTSNRQTNSGSDTESGQSRPKNDKWDYFSDTPQGSIGAVPGGGAQALEGNTYLTTVHHITEDGNGSTTSKTTTYGKVVADSGTVDEDGTSSRQTTTTKTTQSENERNITEESETTLSGTESDSGTNRNTRTEARTDSREDSKTGSETGRDTEETENVRTFNTTNQTDGTTATQGDRTLNNTQEYVEHVAGKMGAGSYSKMLKEFRETLLNIDMMIIKDLRLLFFGLWE